MKELPAVVWGLRTQASRNTGVSHYFMVYGTEAVLPSDVTFGSPRVKNFDQSSADLARELEINCTEEKHLTSCLRTTKLSRVSVRGTLSDAHYEIARTKVETLNSTP